MLSPALDDHAIASSYEIPVLCHPHLNPAANPAVHPTGCPPLQDLVILGCFLRVFLESSESSVDTLMSLGTLSVIATQLLEHGIILDIGLCQAEEFSYSFLTLHATQESGHQPQ